MRVFRERVTDRKTSFFDGSFCIVSDAEIIDRCFVEKNRLRDKAEKKKAVKRRNADLAMVRSMKRRLLLERLTSWG